MAESQAGWDCDVIVPEPVKRVTNKIDKLVRLSKTDIDEMQAIDASGSSVKLFIVNKSLVGLGSLIRRNAQFPGALLEQKTKERLREIELAELVRKARILADELEISIDEGLATILVNTNYKPKGYAAVLTIEKRLTATNLARRAKGMKPKGSRSRNAPKRKMSKPSTPKAPTAEEKRAAMLRAQGRSEEEIKAMLEIFRKFEEKTAEEKAKTDASNEARKRTLAKHEAEKAEWLEARGCARALGQEDPEMPQFMQEALKVKERKSNKSQPPVPRFGASTLVASFNDMPPLAKDSDDDMLEEQPTKKRAPKRKAVTPAASSDDEEKADAAASEKTSKKKRASKRMADAPAAPETTPENKSGSKRMADSIESDRLIAFYPPQEDFVRDPTFVPDNLNRSKLEDFIEDHDDPEHTREPFYAFLKAWGASDVFLHTPAMKLYYYLHCLYFSGDQKLPLAMYEDLYEAWSGRQFRTLYMLSMDDGKLKFDKTYTPSKEDQRDFTKAFKQCLEAKRQLELEVSSKRAKMNADADGAAPKTGGGIAFGPVQSAAPVVKGGESIFKKVLAYRAEKAKPVTRPVQPKRNDWVELTPSVTPASLETPASLVAPAPPVAPAPLVTPAPLAPTEPIKYPLFQCILWLIKDEMEIPDMVNRRRAVITFVRKHLVRQDIADCIGKPYVTAAIIKVAVSNGADPDKPFPDGWCVEMAKAVCTTTDALSGVPAGAQ